MSLEIEHFSTDTFTVKNLYSAQECVDLVARAESIGFDAASVRTRSGPKMLTNIRNNDRVNLFDEELAQDMWSRIQDQLPRLDEASPVGIDPNLRFYRYLPGQSFKRHKDGSVQNSSGDTSKLSYLIYLNGDCEGGYTVFRDYRGSGDDRKKIVSQIKPTTGMALLFRHERWHEGTDVLSGRKYVLRSDVFYRNH